jgi:aspartate kinase
MSAEQIIDEISARSKDSIIGLGERLSCKIMTAVLRDQVCRKKLKYMSIFSICFPQGIDAEYVSLENIVPESDDFDGFGDTSLDQAFYDRLVLAVGERIKQCESRVPVVTGLYCLPLFDLSAYGLCSGFFGPVPGSLLLQVGRGYTDLLSAVLAVGLEAAELQIWKEVDGIFTADPRKVPTARLLSIISPDEAAELTYYGSEVIHPFAMEQVCLDFRVLVRFTQLYPKAIRKRIPIRIKNVDNPRGGGTVIHPDPEGDAPSVQQEIQPFAVPEPVSLSTLNDLALLSEEHERLKLPTAVTIKENIVVLNINSNRKSVSHGFLAGIFGTLDQFGVVVDLISTSEVHVSMAIEEGSTKKMLDKLVKELKKTGTVGLLCSCLGILFHPLVYASGIRSP